MAAKKKSPAPARSKKAGRPPAESTSPPQTRRRQKTATAALSKGTTLSQTDTGPRAAWSGAKPTWKKR